MLYLAAVLITVAAIAIPPLLYTNPSTRCNFTTCSLTQSTAIHVNKVLLYGKLWRPLVTAVKVIKSLKKTSSLLIWKVAGTLGKI